MTINAVIRAEPDGYDLAKVALMGRQSAGNGFLRAAVAARGDEVISAFAPTRFAANAFKSIVQKIDAEAPVDWIPSEQAHRVSERGVLYLADTTMGRHSRMRQRVGFTSFSLCGVTHTTASDETMDQIAGLLREPVAPWDALICTSNAVLETVRRVHDAEAEYLRWRYGAEARIEGPQLPVIPLGVHCDDFHFVGAERSMARAAFDIAEDEIVCLFAGRLAFHAKAHPHAMYRGLQLAAERTGKRLVMILSGWFASAATEAAYRNAARSVAPAIRCIFSDGRELAARRHAWAAADIFVSLADSIQETFGLTPIEAMAANLPVVVTDYNGYKDTVRNGIDGFRVSTCSPCPGAGIALARAMEAGSLNYDEYCWATTASTAVDIGEVANALAALVENPSLRRKMGGAGRARARELYDWPMIYRQYQELWGDLNARRLAATANPEQQVRARALRTAAASRLDPFEAFGHYPTHQLSGRTRIAIAPGATSADLHELLAHEYFLDLALPRQIIEDLFQAMDAGDSLEALSKRLEINLAPVVRATGLLLKLGMANVMP